MANKTTALTTIKVKDGQLICQMTETAFGGDASNNWSLTLPNNHARYRVVSLSQGANSIATVSSSVGSGLGFLADLRDSDGKLQSAARASEPYILSETNRIDGNLSRESCDALGIVSAGDTINLGFGELDTNVSPTASCQGTVVLEPA